MGGIHQVHGPVTVRIKQSLSLLLIFFSILNQTEGDGMNLRPTKVHPDSAAAAAADRGQPVL